MKVILMILFMSISLTVLGNEPVQLSKDQQEKYAREIQDLSVQILKKEREAFLDVDIESVHMENLFRLENKKDETKIKFNFKGLEEDDFNTCKALEGKIEEYKSLRREESMNGDSDEREEYLEMEQSNSSILAFVNNESDRVINLCHRFFTYQHPLDKNREGKKTRDFLAQILIHESTHLTLGHTHQEFRDYFEKEQEASFYTYEQMIHSTAKFYEDMYYILLGFNSKKFTYFGIPYQNRYRLRVIRHKAN